MSRRDIVATMGNVQTTVRLPRDIITRLDRLATHTKRSRNAMITVLLEGALDRAEKK